MELEKNLNCMKFVQQMFQFVAQIQLLYLTQSGLNNKNTDIYRFGIRFAENESGDF
jgi:hypothetical protein